jgi:hypothetical protein
MNELRHQPLPFSTVALAHPPEMNIPLPYDTGIGLAGSSYHYSEAVGLIWGTRKLIIYPGPCQSFLIMSLCFAPRLSSTPRPFKVKKKKL